MIALAKAHSMIHLVPLAGQSYPDAQANSEINPVVQLNGRICLTEWEHWLCHSSSVLHLTVRLTRSMRTRRSA